MNQVFMDPGKLEEKANRIETLSKEMKTKMNEVNASVKSLRTDWEDDVQVDYEAEFTKLVNSFEGFANTIPAYAQTARDHAENMRRIGRR